MGRRDRSRQDQAEVTPARLRALARQKRDEAARVRSTGEWIGRVLWLVSGLALVFTMANVTQFATGHGTSVWIAWLLDPMVSLALLVVLIGDSVLSRNNQSSGPWPTALKWLAGAATWSMNVWQSAQARDTAGIVLHSVPPALVIGLAEVTPVYRKHFAELAIALEVEASTLAGQADAIEAAEKAAADPAPAGPQPPLPVMDRAEPDRTSGPWTGPADGPDRGMDRATGVDRRTSGPVVRLVSDRTTNRTTDRASERTADRSTTVARRASVPAARSGRADRTVGEDRTAALLPKARRIADKHLAKTGRPIARRPLAEALRAAGETCSTDTAATLLDLLAAPAQPQAALQVKAETEQVADVDQVIHQAGDQGTDAQAEALAATEQTAEARELVGVGEHVG